MNYYLSDLHLFHNNILKLCHRPFANIEEMHETIINNWKQKVGKKDMVYLLGDIGLYHPEEIADILHSLPGKKVLIKGNHDIYNLKNRKFCDSFIKITSYLEVKDNKDTIALFHYPIEEWNGYFRKRLHFHGHVHNNDKNLLPLQGRYNVSVDVINYMPMTKEEIIGGKTNVRI